MIEIPKPFEAHIAARARRQEPDRMDLQVPQDLRAEPDLAPLGHARGRALMAFAGLTGERCGGHARSAFAQIDEDAAPARLEGTVHGLERALIAEDVAQDILAMQGAPDVLSPSTAPKTSARCSRSSKGVR